MILRPSWRGGRPQGSEDGRKAAQTGAMRRRQRIHNSAGQSEGFWDVNHEV